MSAYNPPIPTPPTVIYNPLEYVGRDASLTQSQADARYLKKAGDTATGLENFNAGITTTNITFQGDSTVQSTAFKDLSPAPTGTYTNATVTVNSKGQVTSASSGATPANSNVYNYPQIWRCATLYGLGSSVPLPAGAKSADILIPLPASGGLTNTKQAMSVTVEILYNLMEDVSYGATVDSRVMASWYSVVLIQVSPLNGGSPTTLVKLVDTTSTGTSAWSSQSITYHSQPPVGGGYSTGTFTPLSYTYTNGASPHPTLTITFGGFNSPFLNASSAGGATNYQPLMGIQRTVRIIDCPIGGNNYDTTNRQTYPNSNTAIYPAYFVPVTSSS